MARDILSEYGPDSANPQAGRGSNQGRDKRDVMNYSPPRGPTNILDAESPGLHGDNCGDAGYQNSGHERKQSSGSPGLHGQIKNVQGRH